MGPEVELSAPSPAPRLPACHHASHHLIVGRASDTVSQPQLNVFLYKSSCGNGVKAIEPLAKTRTMPFNIFFRDFFKEEKILEELEDPQIRGLPALALNPFQFPEPTQQLTCQ